MSISVAGVLPVIATPFDEQSAIDFGSLGDELDWLFAHGAHGVTIAMVSELHRMTNAERMRLTDAVCELVAGRGPVVASVGTESTPGSVELARAARAGGVAAVMLAPPMVTATSEAELRRHLDAVVEAAGVPTILQDASSYAGQAIPAATQANLVDTYGSDILMLKPESVPLGPTVTAIHEAARATPRIFDGSGGIALTETHARGIVGTMPGPDLIWAIRAIWNALEAGDRRAAMSVAGPLTMLQSMIFGLDSYVAFEKFLLVEQQVLRTGHRRGPLGYELDATARLIARELLQALRDSVENLSAELRHPAGPAVPAGSPPPGTPPSGHANPVAGHADPVAEQKAPS